MLELLFYKKIYCLIEVFFNLLLDSWCYKRSTAAAADDDYSGDNYDDDPDAVMVTGTYCCCLKLSITTSYTLGDALH